MLSKPQLNLNTTSTVVGFDMKMTVQTTPHKLNGSNISAVTDPISTKQQQHFQHH